MLEAKLEEMDGRGANGDNLPGPSGLVCGECGECNISSEPAGCETGWMGYYTAGTLLAVPFT